MRYLIFIFIVCGCSPNNETASPITLVDSISDETIGLKDSLSASIEALDSLKPVVQQTIDKIKYYEGLKKSYENEIRPLVVYNSKKEDSSEVHDLRMKLAYANKKIESLQLELARVTKKPSNDIVSGIQPAQEIPSGDGIVIQLSGESRRGEKIPIPDNLSVYLIPYTKKVKKLMVYESSCDESELRQYSGYRISKYYNGVYFFNDVEPGKYLIKVCCYYGNFKLIDKYTGSQTYVMQISPPLQ